MPTITGVSSLLQSHLERLEFLMASKSIFAARIGVMLAFAIIWEGAARASAMIAFSISRPTLVAAALLNLCRGGAILPHIAATGGAALIGVVTGTLIGASMGLCTWFSRSAALVLRPFIVALGALPILAIAPMMIIWFGIDFRMKAVLATLSTIFVAFAQSARGVENVSSVYIQVLRGMNASEGQIFTKVILPGSLDWVFSSMRMNTGLALLGAFIGEFIASSRGLGYLVLHASSLYDVPRALAASLFIVLLAVAFDGMGALIERRRNVIIRLFCIPYRIW